MQRSAILTAVPHGRGRTRQVTIRNVGDEVALELGIQLMAEKEDRTDWLEGTRPRVLGPGKEVCLDIAQGPGPTECRLIVSWVDGRGNTSRWVGAISRR
jgi:hypothetical protein